MFYIKQLRKILFVLIISAIKVLAPVRVSAPASVLILSRIPVLVQVYSIFISRSYAQEKSLEQLRQRQQKERKEFRRFREDLDRVSQLKKDIEGIEKKEKLDKKSKYPFGHKQTKKCIFVQEIQIQGEIELSSKEKKQAIENFLDRCVGIYEFNKLLEEITKIYIQKGYVTSRAYLPKQSMEGALIKVFVLMGKIEDIRFATDEKGESLGYRSEILGAFPFLIGGILNLRDIEQGLDQLNRLSSNSARIHLFPGSSLGTSIIVISKARKKKWSSSLRLDNFGSANTDYVNANYSFSYDNLMYLNDFQSLSYQENVLDKDENEAKSFSWRYIQPFGAFTFHFYLTRFSYLNHIQGEIDSFESSGKSSSKNTGVKYLLHRNQVGKTHISYENQYSTSQNYINDILVESSSRSIQKHSWGISYSHILYRGFLQISAYHKQAEMSALLEVDTEDLHVKKNILNLSFSQNFSLGKEKLQWNLLGEGQEAKEVLFSGEQIGIGGPSSVRGFRKASLVGDHGFYLQNELAYFPSYLIFGKMQSHLFLAYDLGVVMSRSKELEHRGGQLEGFALGLRTRHPNFEFDISYVQSLRKPDYFEKERIWYFSSTFRY